MSVSLKVEDWSSGFNLILIAKFQAQHLNKEICLVDVLSPHESGMVYPRFSLFLQEEGHLQAECRLAQTNAFTCNVENFKLNITDPNQPHLVGLCARHDGDRMHLGLVADKTYRRTAFQLSSEFLLPRLSINSDFRIGGNPSVGDKPELLVQYIGWFSEEEISSIRQTLIDTGRLQA